MITVFESLQKPNKPIHTTVERVLEQIRTGGKMKKQILELRSLAKEDADGSEKMKRKLAGICFGGKFKTRNMNDCEEGSGLMILDFDDTPEGFVDRLLADEFIYAVFVSPRGGGYKALVKIPPVTTNDEYKKYFMAYAKRWPELDHACCDIVRFCFFSYDPHLYIKLDPPVWTETTDTKEVNQETKQPSSRSVKTNWKKLAVGIEMIGGAEVGNRHNTIIKAGRLMGGYIGSGEVNESDVLTVFENHIQEKDPNDFRDNWRTFLTGIEHGKNEPIDSVSEIEIERKLGQIEYTLDGETRERLDALYENGYAKGYHVGWDCFRNLYTVHLGYTTYLYGSPFSGKTYWWLEVLVNLSTFYNLKHAIFSPETGNEVDVFKTLIEIKAGEDFLGRYNNKKMDKKLMDETANWVAKHFIVIDPADEDLNVKDCLDYVDIIERKYNTKIHTITIDPWNELEHEDARDVRALEKELKHVRRNAKKNKRHICIITHIRDQDPIKDGTTVYFPIPTPRDIMGGQTWYRKGFMMISFWRIMTFHDDGQDTVKIGKREFAKNTTIVQIQKAKPNGTGKLGEVEIRWDAKRHKFFESNGKYSHLIEDEAQREETKTLFVDKPSDDVPF